MKNQESISVDEFETKYDLMETKKSEEMTTKAATEQIGKVPSQTTSLQEENCEEEVSTIVSSHEEETKNEDITINLTEKSSKKKEKRNKIPVYLCKHCDNKFSKTTQLASHMKTCHTRPDEVTPIGNAITVNSPCLAVKHFFCHCSICGNGYDDYSQLSDHERDKHSVKCFKCEEGLMTESDVLSGT